MCPRQRIAEDNQRPSNENVPGVEERQPAQDQCDGEETGLADSQLAEVQVDPAAPAAEEEVQRHRHSQQIERDRQHVRMKVTQQEREERELVDDLTREVIQVIILHYA